MFSSHTIFILGRLIKLQCFYQRREWTKNLRQNWDVCKGREACHSCEAYGLRCTIQPCYGVNLDRNFEYQWIPGSYFSRDKLFIVCEKNSDFGYSKKTLQRD